ncbi:uncharacterized protein JCM6883_002812 [Sporobolomyces salmoneus]|uniref:uncharacterized protein n=1 Tax=Sporobolomyces salmoneus TaxID=183962 RepID=UPI00317D3FCC
MDTVQPVEGHYLVAPLVPEFLAWVEVDGEPAKVYGAEVTENKAVGYIEAKEGQQFKVCYLDNPLERQFRLSPSPVQTATSSTLESHLSSSSIFATVPGNFFSSTTTSLVGQSHIQKPQQASNYLSLVDSPAPSPEPSPSPSPSLSVSPAPAQAQSLDSPVASTSTSNPNPSGSSAQPSQSSQSHNPEPGRLARLQAELESLLRQERIAALRSEIAGLEGEVGGIGGAGSSSWNRKVKAEPSDDQRDAKKVKREIDAATFSASKSNGKGKGKKKAEVIELSDSD